MKQKEIMQQKYETEQIKEWKRKILALIKMNKAYRIKVSERKGFSPARNRKDLCVHQEADYERREFAQE